MLQQAGVGARGGEGALGGDGHGAAPPGKASDQDIASTSVGSRTRTGEAAGRVLMRPGLRWSLFLKLSQAWARVLPRSLGF